ncbi:hypothetical protein E3N88_03447 [Mikania micrantha]|uniref:Uncharacterized protein n=1 Tax=Mikania micrantha TaxID=192012 RepID=A0A5N6Q8V2_9ASTR|nr:hypothetical protein E3N88_03447 [Mikania micrantha]
MTKTVFRNRYSVALRDRIGDIPSATRGIETITDNAVPQDFVQVPPPAKEYRDGDDSEIKVLCIEKPLESSDVLEQIVEPETKMGEPRVPPPVQGIFDFSDPDVDQHIDLYLKQGLQVEAPQEGKLSKDEAPPVDEEREIKGPAVIPVIPTSRILPNSTFRYIPSPEEVKQIDWAAYFDSITANLEEEPEDPKPETLMDDTVPPLVQEEIESSVSEPVGELLGKPESGEFDPERDLAELEALLRGEPEISEWMAGKEELLKKEDELDAEIEKTLSVGTFEDVGVVSVVEKEIRIKPLDVRAESSSIEHEHSAIHLLVRRVVEKLPPKSRPSRKKLKEMGDISELRTVKTPSVGIFRDDRLLGYIFRIIFRPSRFKSSWFNEMKRASMCVRILGFCLTCSEEVLPLRLEAVLRSIKEKPPD